MKNRVFLILIQAMVFFTGTLFGYECPAPDFTYSRNCEYYIFNAFGEPNSTYSWNFGDGTPATAFSINNNYVLHVYSNNGTYSVTLSEHHASPGCTPQTTTRTILVNVYNTTVSLTAGATIVSVNTPVELSFFTDYDPNWGPPIWSYRLDIGGEIIEPATSPYYWTPTVSGSYQVILVASVHFGEEFCNFYDTVTINVIIDCGCENSVFAPPSEICVGNPAVFCNLPSCTPGVNFTWDFGDGVTSSQPIHTYSAAGSYLVRLILIDTVCNQPISYPSVLVEVTHCAKIGSDDCIGSFAPTVGDYMVGTWVKEANGSNITTYANAGVKISFVGSSIVYGPYMPDPATKIIDGWQRIESPKWALPVNATQIIVELVNTGASAAYFDDIRIHPFESNMKTYVYDPITLRLAAELDENNYATFYEYDEDGALIRVKKETDKGIVTIKETRNNNKK